MYDSSEFEYDSEHPSEVHSDCEFLQELPGFGIGKFFFY